MGCVVNQGDVSPIEFKLRCTIHDFLFGFQRKEGIEPAHLSCPICAREQIEKLHADNKRLAEHRDLLLQAIDLKKLVQPA